MRRTLGRAVPCFLRCWGRSVRTTHSAPPVYSVPSSSALPHPVPDDTSYRDLTSRPAMLYNFRTGEVVTSLPQLPMAPYQHLRNVYHTYGLYATFRNESTVVQHLVKLCQVSMEHAALQGHRSISLALHELLPWGEPVDEAMARSVGRYLETLYGAAHVAWQIQPHPEDRGDCFPPPVACTLHLDWHP